MSRYLTILNWTIAIVLVLSAIFIRSYYGGWAFVIGMVLGGVLSAGFPTWEFEKDQSSDKDFRWRKQLFNKEYLDEMIVRLVLLMVNFVASWFFWRAFFHLMTGFLFIWVIGLLVEWLWGAAHRYYGNKR